MLPIVKPICKDLLQVLQDKEYEVTEEKFFFGKNSMIKIKGFKQWFNKNDFTQKQ